jgi:hypothetical protein
MRSVRLLAAAGLLCWTAVPAVHGQAQAQLDAVPLQLTAFAVNMSNIAPGTSAMVDIKINQWSTEATRTKLINTFVEKGPSKLLDALQDQKPVGYIKLPNTLGYDLRFARETPTDDGGRRIVIVTDRYITQWEAMNQPRTMDYPFTLIEIHLKKDGTGEGKLSVATKITLNKKDNVVEIENYSSEPVRLNQIHIQK